jgi:hypothetical protein
LSVIGEDQQPSAFGSVNHALGQDMDISNGCGPDRPCRFPVLPDKTTPMRTTGHTIRQLSLVIITLLHKMERREYLLSTASQALGDVFIMYGTAIAADIQSLRPGRGIVIRITANLVVKGNRPGSSIGTFQWSPVPVRALRNATSRFSPSEKEVFETMLEIMLTTGVTTQYWKPVHFFVPGQRVFGRKPQSGLLCWFGEGHDRTADSSHETVNYRPQQRSGVLPRCRP